MTRSELETLIKQRGVHPIFGSPGEDDWCIEQNADELAQFIEYAQGVGVQSVLEIGTGWKSGLSRFMANDLGWHVTSIDVNNYHHVYPNIHYIVLARPDEIATFDRRFDLVIIDGDHAYESVKRDYAAYAPLADKLVMLHDICGLRECEGVAQFWEIVPGDVEFIAAGAERAGIGVVDVSVMGVPAEPKPKPEPKPKTVRKPAKKKAAK